MHTYPWYIYILLEFATSLFICQLCIKYTNLNEYSPFKGWGEVHV